MPDSESNSRSKHASATFTAIGLAFFFGVGLAGGAAYKVYFGDDGGSPVADQVSPPTPVSPSPPAQNFAAKTSSDTEKATPDLARSEPSAPPAPEPARQAVSDAAVAPAAPDAQPETQTAKPARRAATSPKKPAMVAKAQPTASAQNTGPQAVAPHPPPNGPGAAAGPFRVQFGAFAKADNARRVQWAIEATGLKVEISQEPGPSGHPLFFLRSPPYPDRAAAVSAAQMVQNRVQHFVNAVAIDYAILSDRSAPQQQADAH